MSSNLSATATALLLILLRLLLLLLAHLTVRQSDWLSGNTNPLWINRSQLALTWSEGVRRNIKRQESITGVKCHPIEDGELLALSEIPHGQTHGGGGVRIPVSAG